MLIAAILCLNAGNLIACGEVSENVEQTTSAQTQNNSDSTEDESVQDNLPELDFDGEVINVL